MGHAERLMPMVEEVMEQAGLSFAELHRIVLTRGPGTFTGARITVSAARALSLATGAPLVAISSLQLMAFHPALSSDGAGTLAIAMDARRGEVYFQTFEAQSLAPRGEPRLLSPGEAAAQLKGTKSVIAGSGADAVAGAARALNVEAQAVLPGLLPDAIDMLFAAYAWPTEGRVSPLYLRPPDAKPPRASGLGREVA